MNPWKLNKSPEQPVDQRRNEKGNKKYSEANEIGNTAYQNLQDAAKPSYEGLPLWAPEQGPSAGGAGVHRGAVTDPWRSPRLRGAQLVRVVWGGAAPPTFSHVCLSLDGLGAAPASPRVLGSSQQWIVVIWSCEGTAGRNDLSPLDGIAASQILHFHPGGLGPNSGWLSTQFNV